MDPPPARYVHPKAAGLVQNEGTHDFALDTADEAAPRYLRWVADQVTPHLGSTVLEVGSGVGAITQHLAEGRHLVATDVSDHCIEALQARFRNTSNVDVVQADLRTWSSEQTFDSVVLINVLEHIHDDVGALETLSRFVSPGGTAVVYVPALNGLYGSWDLKVGHYRRYSKPRLTAVFREANLEPVDVRYSNLLAIPAWFAFSHLSRLDDTGGRSLPVWDRVAVPISRFLEARVRVPIGLNVLGVARRTRV